MEPKDNKKNNDLNIDKYLRLVFEDKPKAKATPETKERLNKMFHNVAKMITGNDKTTLDFDKFNRIINQAIDSNPKIDNLHEYHKEFTDIWLAEFNYLKLDFNKRLDESPLKEKEFIETELMFIDEQRSSGKYRQAELLYKTGKKPIDLQGFIELADLKAVDEFSKYLKTLLSEYETYLGGWSAKEIAVLFWFLDRYNIFKPKLFHSDLTAQVKFLALLFGIEIKINVKNTSLYQHCKDIKEVNNNKIYFTKSNLTKIEPFMKLTENQDMIRDFDQKLHAARILKDITKTNKN